MLAQTQIASDTSTFSGNRDAYTVVATPSGYTVTDNVGDGGITTVPGTVTRLQFADLALAFDIENTAGKAYRLYQAAFNRTPDLGGLGYWIGVMDRGGTPAQVAAGFAASAEFKDLYGTNPTNAELVARYYLNVLHRAGEPDGVAYWLGALDGNKTNAVELLTYFSESKENKDGVLAALQGGIRYVVTPAQAPVAPFKTVVLKAFSRLGPNVAVSASIVTATAQSAPVLTVAGLLASPVNGYDVSGGATISGSFATVTSFAGGSFGQVCSAPASPNAKPSRAYSLVVDSATEVTVGEVAGMSFQGYQDCGAMNATMTVNADGSARYIGTNTTVDLTAAQVLAAVSTDGYIDRDGNRDRTRFFRSIVNGTTTYAAVDYGRSPTNALSGWTSIYIATPSAPSAAQNAAQLASNIWVREAKDATQTSLVLRFAANGQYLLGEVGPAGGGGMSGVEYGTFVATSTDARGAVLAAAPIVDTNGEWGASHPQPCDRIVVNGDQLLFRSGTSSAAVCTQVDESAVDKVPGNGSGIVGAWAADSATLIKTPLMVFFADGAFVMLDPLGDTAPNPCGGPGVESGRYSYDSALKKLKITSFAYNTNGCAGLSMSGAETAAGMAFAISADGKTATLPDGSMFYRVK